MGYVFLMRRTYCPGISLLQKKPDCRRLKIVPTAATVNDLHAELRQLCTKELAAAAVRIFILFIPKMILGWYFVRNAILSKFINSLLALAQFFLQQLIDHLGICFALGLFHDLADKEAHDFTLSGAVLLDLFRVFIKDVINELESTLLHLKPAPALFLLLE